MEVEIGELDTQLTVTNTGDLMERRAFERLVRAVTSRVVDELRRSERRRTERIGTQRVDPDRY